MLSCYHSIILSFGIFAFWICVLFCSILPALFIVLGFLLLWQLFVLLFVSWYCLLAFEAFHQILERREEKVSVIKNLKAIFQILFQFWQIFMSFSIHPNLEYTKIFLYFDSHTIYAGCDLSEWTYQSKNSVFPKFVCLLFLNFEGIIATLSILRVFPHRPNPFLEYVNVSLCQIQEVLLSAILLGLTMNQKNCQNYFTVPKVTAGFSFYSKVQFVYCPFF